ncbi:DUF3389 family protein [Shewanella sp. WXL01]|uniref:DUF3389 family protein n=1 Tax=Shewanella maritima TaxID=2520507 RepID=A0A411PLS3_9GAMM|nr:MULTISPECIES: DUF3389 family protein [Shewanella]NKF51603.1 DUF3389 family protein [Shewanella sp. WXL01]QBF84477.1 DUF3389 family protein [Shewanella maritima]
MIISFSQGRLIVTAQEVQCRIVKSNLVMAASVDDLTIYRQGRVIVADAGTVRWSVSLDDDEQLQQVLAETGLDAL